MERLFLSVEELAKRWGFGTKKIYQMKDDPKDPIPHYKFKASIRFKLEDIERYEATHQFGRRTNGDQT